MIFPPHIPHGTYPQTKGIRQSFNLDYELEFDEKCEYLTYLKMNYKIIDNALPQEEFENIKNNILNSNFPWNLTNVITNEKKFSQHMLLFTLRICFGKDLT